MKKQKEAIKFSKESITRLVTEQTIPAIENFLEKYQNIYIRVSHCDLGEIDFNLYGMKDRKYCDVLEIRSRKNREIHSYTFTHELKSTFNPKHHKDPFNMMNRLFEVK
jgi:hypothetical protein